MVFTILGDAKPASGWPAGAAGAMGTITPIESGYYNQKLVRVGDSGSSSRCRFAITCRWPSEANG
jgi:hypothetical protein